MPKRGVNLYEKFAGLLTIAAALLLVFFVVMAQSIYPGYNLNTNYISDLGVGMTAPIFNSAIVFFGVMIFMVSYLILASRMHRLLAYGFALIGFGAMGVGLFPETTGILHLVFAGITFGSAALTALGFSRTVKGPMEYISVIAGAIGLAILLLSALRVGSLAFLGLGPGGLEEILFYSEMAWSVIFGIFLIQRNRNGSAWFK